MKYVIKSSRKNRRHQFAIQLLKLILNHKFNYEELDIRWGRLLFQLEFLNKFVSIWFWMIVVSRWDVIRISDEKSWWQRNYLKNPIGKATNFAHRWNFVCHKSFLFFISKQITSEFKNDIAGPYWLIIFCKLWLRNRKVAHPVY